VSAPLSERPCILDVAGDVRFERLSAPPADVERIAFLAHWSPTARQSRSVSRLIAELQRGGYRVVLSSTSEAPGEFVFHPAEPVKLDELTIIRRSNVGYDFGSWAVAMNAFPDTWGADKVLVLNDSLVGPFAPIDHILADFESTSADVWGLVENDQFTSHLQSYFRGFRHGVLSEEPLAEFWRDIRVIEDKLELIGAYEFGFTHILTTNRYTSACFVHHREVVRNGLNPTAAGWEGLLRLGVPFVKRENFRPGNKYLTDPHRIPEVVRERYGVDVHDWF
jgi:hypothetical protein